ncbi:MAG: ribosome maturation factor RimM [Clostridiales Family XIII bacterium]|nr:ribosome maturation factor RimM [Clostridiales Family XIII bacterium]
MTDRARLLIGKISGAFGVKGELKLYHYSGDSERLENLREARCLIKNRECDFKVLSVRMQKKTPIIRLEGIEDRNAAESLVGAEVFAYRDELAPADGEGFFVEEIMGAVFTDRGRDIGVVSGFVDNPAHGILEVETHAGEKLLIPLVDSFIRVLSVEEKKVEADLTDMGLMS